MENTYLQQVGERVQKCRNRKFLSKTELSRRAGVSVCSITKMEKGKESLRLFGQPVRDIISSCF